ncbi:MAG: hypothetical protein ACTSX6_10545 [Candidatus Heimdallarchaeaceae archaeon]
MPWNEDTPDAKGFWNYAKEHYLNAWRFANETMKQSLMIDGDPRNLCDLRNMIFDKVSSPLVYLYEAWSVLPPETKAKYNPELAKIHEETEKIADRYFGKEEK